jgi:hypothetical protein
MVWLPWKSKKKALETTEKKREVQEASTPKKGASSASTPKPAAQGEKERALYELERRPMRPAYFLHALHFVPVRSAGPSQTTCEVGRGTCLVPVCVWFGCSLYAVREAPAKLFRALSFPIPHTGSDLKTLLQCAALCSDRGTGPSEGRRTTARRCFAHSLLVPPPATSIPVPHLIAMRCALVRCDAKSSHDAH